MSQAERTAQDQGQGLIAFIKRHRHALVNVYVFLNIASWVGWQTWKTWAEGKLGYVEVAFAIQNLIFLTLILIRHPPRSLDRNVAHQAVALLAFFSGLAFIGQAPTGRATALAVSGGVTFAANLLGAVSLVNLGRSFGILIARRPVKTGGLYGWVRHPMYGTDILLRIGFAVGHFNTMTCVLLVLSSACYVYRAILEERFLAEDPEYRRYMERVRYRFVPFAF